jgi:hypothetical protein
MQNSETHIRLGGSLWFLVVFGLFFAAMGGFFLYMLLTDPTSIKVNNRPGKIGDAWFPFIFIAIGLGIAGIRAGKVLNFEQRCLTSWWGWYMFVKRSDAPLGTWQRVELRPREMRGSGKHRRSVVPVFLIGDHCNEEIQALREEAQARRFAERIAKAAKIPLADRSSGEVVERNYDQLDDSIVQHITDADLNVAVPARTRLRISDDLRGRQISAGLSPALLLAPFMMIPFLGVLAFWYFAWYPGQSERAAKDWFSWAFAYAPLILMIGIPALIGLFSALSKGLFGFTLTADSDGGVRVLRQTIPITLIEDIRVIKPDRGNRYLAIITDKKWIRFGYGQSRDDLDYLRAFILQGLKGRR